MSKNKLIPEWRFPEFEKDGGWDEKRISELGDTINGLTGKSGDDFGNGRPYVTYKQVFDNSIIDFEKCGKVQINNNENQNTLQKGDILFIDEIHRLSPLVEEYLYSAMEDYRIDIMIESGPNARSIQIGLNPFTLIGATTRSGLLTSPLRARFGINSRLSYYDAKLLASIIKRSAAILKIAINHEAAAEIAVRSRGTPRIANALLRRVRDFAMVKGNGAINKEITCIALDALHVDRYGLDEMDNRILTTIIQKFKGGPVGVNTIATACGEDAETIEEVYEPYLIQEGFLMRTPRGREVTALAYRHLGFIAPNKQGGLFGDTDV